MTDKYCSQCGSQVRQGAVYCVNCGAILSSDPPIKPISLFPFGTAADTASFTRREAIFEKENIETIHVACKVLNVETLSTKNDVIKITWDESNSWNVSAEQVGNSLRIAEQSLFSLRSIPDIFTLHQHKELRIEVPSDYRGALITETETGSISISNFETNGEIGLKSTTGPIKARNLKTNNDFRADSSNGVLDITNIDAAQTVRLSSMSSSMQVESIKTGIGFSATSVSGSCQFRDVTAAKYFSVTGSVGRVILDAIHAEKIDVGLSGSGLVDCREIFAEDCITITSSTGAITCGINDEAANFTTHCRSVHGRCSLPEISGNGPKVLRVSTSVGNIDVWFKDAG